MPDPTKQSVSASQTPVLFGQSPYATRWMLHQHFAKGLPLDAPEDERTRWGSLLQDDILEATALSYRMEMQPNIANEYTRAGRLGATIDGRMIMPDRGPVIVEAKNIDWLRWRDTWTKTAAAPHVEIQLQTQMLVAGELDAEPRHGIIAALVGGNELVFHERAPDAELHDRIREEAAHFFEDLAAGREPDPFGSPLELPMLAALYPETTPREVVEDYDDEELALAIRQFAWAKGEESFARKLKEQMQAKIMARAGAAEILRANGATCYFSRAAVAPSVCQPHSEPKQTRAASVRLTIKVEETAPRDGAPPDALTAGDVA